MDPLNGAGNQTSGMSTPSNVHMPQVPSNTQTNDNAVHQGYIANGYTGPSPTLQTPPAGQESAPVYQPPAQRVTPLPTPSSMDAQPVPSIQYSDRQNIDAEPPRKRLLRAADLAPPNASNESSPHNSNVTSPLSDPSPPPLTSPAQEESRSSTPSTLQLRANFDQFRFNNSSGNSSSSASPAYPPVQQPSYPHPNNGNMLPPHMHSINSSPVSPGPAPRATSGSRPVIADDEDSPVKHSQYPTSVPPSGSPMSMPPVSRPYPYAPSPMQQSMTPPQSMTPQSMPPPQGIPPQSMPPIQGIPPQGIPPQSMPPHSMPLQAMPQGMMPHNISPHGIPSQPNMHNMHNVQNIQGMPPNMRSMPQNMQNMPPSGAVQQRPLNTVQIPYHYVESAQFLKSTAFPDVEVRYIIAAIYQHQGNVEQATIFLRRVQQAQHQHRQQQMPPQAAANRTYLPPMNQAQYPRNPALIHNNTMLSRPLQGSNSVPKKKKRMRDDSDSESAGDYDSDGSGDYDDGQDLALKEEKALEFFNTGKEAEMPDLTACSAKQAEIIISLRPFDDVGDLRAKLRKQKGVSASILDSYLAIMDGYEAVDDVFKSCEFHGQELSEILKVWGNGNKQEHTSTSASESASRSGTPDVDAGVSLANVDVDKLPAADSVDIAKPHIRSAMENFIQKQPKYLGESVTLKDYQLLGLNWLNLLYNRRTSCILADEMGLGKTVQVIALFAHLKEKGGPGPHLVIVPSSTLENWLREFNNFAPDLEVACYYGTQAERYEIRQDLKERKDIDVIVTTYNMATGASDDRKFLRKMSFKTCVYDEGHQLKNSQSKKYRDLMEIKVDWRLLLTGTPLQNNLQELVSLLSFILPKLFGKSAESLRAIFKVPHNAQANLLTQKRIHAAKRVMTPFVLRRKKVQVLKDLPNKLERIEYCEMNEAQKEIYNDALLRSKRVIMEKSEQELEKDAETKLEEEEKTNEEEKKPTKKVVKPPEETSASSANVLMELRKASAHPMLFRRLYEDKMLKNMARDIMREVEFMDKNVDYIKEDMEIMTDFELHRLCTQYKHLQKYELKEEEWMKAGKVEFLKTLLPKLKEEGHRVLLFSQFTQVLEILEYMLQSLDIKYLKLTGQTPVGERQGMVDIFTEDEEISVFLLSTRAGGLGLNLMAADTVIIYDQDFNPHMDRQAADRAWRIGQTKDVNVIKLITKETIEEDILAIAQTKMKLDETVSSVTNEANENAPQNGGEGDSGTIEKKMKGSLLKQLRQRFEGTQGQTVQSQTISQIQTQPPPPIENSL